MLPELFQKRITALDELTFTDLVGRLLLAEARAVGLEPDAFTYSLEVKVGDEGLDGEAREVPAGQSTVFPDGSSGYQFKAVRGWFADLDLETEVQKAGSRRILEGGGTYVLAWSRELNPRQQREVEAELQRCASLVTDHPKTRVWSASHIAALCIRYPAVPQALRLVQFGPAQSLQSWLRSLQSEDRPFFQDEARRQLIETLRDWLRQGEGGLVARVSGDSGIGKSRAVAQALDTDEFRDITFYAPTSEGLTEFLGQIIEDDQLEAVIVVDEVGAGDVSRLQEQVAAAGERIRLVMIGLAGSHRTLPGRYDLELGALSDEAMTQLVERELESDTTAASFVAQAAEGYPQMAFEILEEIKRDREAADLSRLARTRRPRELLERAVPREVRAPLGVLALFHSVGCRDDLEPELDEIAAVFPVAGTELRRTIRDFEDRYVRVAGRRCYVRPKLVATWLAGEILEEHGEQVIAWVEQLSPGLQDRFVSQLENFGSGPSTFHDILGKFIERTARFREPTDFDEAAGRFLRAAAAVAPEQVAESIAALVSNASRDERRSLPRRDLVWALEYLLWWPETYERAIRSLFLLAEDETEEWSNNATGEFVESFQIVLGGTLVPHADRLAWLRAQLEGAEGAQLVLIAKAAAAGLSTHHSRMVSGRRGQLEPRDWRPHSQAEVDQAHRDSLALLFECVDRAETDGPVREQIAARLSDHLRSAIAFGLIDDVAAQIPRREWTTRERAEVAGSLRDVRRYDNPSPDLDAKIGVLLAALSGGAIEERLATLFATKPWDLIEGEDWRAVPPAVAELVEEVADSEELLRTGVTLVAEAPADGSSFQFFMQCAERLGPKKVVDVALSASPRNWSVVAAALTQARSSEESEWADHVLADALERSPESVPTLLRSVPLTPDRVDFIERAISTTDLNGDAFADLLYGAPVRDLERADAVRLVEVIAHEGSHRGVEAALGMLHQWLDIHPDQADATAETVVKLASKAAQLERPGNMADHYLEELFKQVHVSFDARASVWKERVVRADIEDREALSLIQSLLKEDPVAAAELVLDTLDDAVNPPYERWAFALEDGKLLSAAARATSADLVWARVETYDDTKLRFLLRHTDWNGNEPDPLVRVFLLSERRGELEDEASVNFFNALGVVSGPFHLAMERELSRANSWLENLKGTSAENWARGLVSAYEKRVEAERLRDAEEDLEFR